MRGLCESEGCSSSREVAAALEARIRRGWISPGQPLPPVRELARHFSVAPMTIRRAVSALRESGVVRTSPRVGTFVAERTGLEAVALVAPLRYAERSDDVAQVQHEILVGAQQACSERAITLMVATDRDNPARLLKRGTGVILVMPMGAEMTEWVHAVMNSGLPWVSLGIDHGLMNFIERDDVAAARMALEHLYRLGHRRVGLLPRLRYNGLPVFAPIRMADPSWNAVMSPIRLVHADDTEGQWQATSEAMAKLFDAGDPPTAVFVGVDLLVHHALRWLEEHGLRTPEDCSVAGYCREVFGLWRGRRITRVDNPRRLSARRAVEELERMESEPGYQTGRAFVAPEWFDGETCGEVIAARAGGQ